jgi:cell division protein FtsQ
VTARTARGGYERGGGQRGRQKGRGGGNRGTGTRRTKAPGLFETIGFAPGAVRRLGSWLFGALTIVVVVAAIFAFRLPQLAGLAMGEGLGKAGFTMKRVELTGNQRVSTLAIYNVAFDQDSMAMPLIDLAATRARLLRFGWIRDAQVSRRLPDTLVIHVIERVPAAVWQNNQQLNLIDAEGIVLEPVRIDHMPDQLPLLLGPEANRHVAGLEALLEAAPRLRPQVAGANWVGERRWDVRFQSGETLSLPEGDQESRRALLSFAALDQQESLLGRGFVRIDMRDPRRVYIRISHQPGATVPPPPQPPVAVPAARRTPQDLSRTI